MAVKIIAHRGANRFAPQNTLPAFQKAFELGADGIETDVHLTADGVPVICHNYKIDEMSNGKGYISDMTLEEFKSFDFGSGFSEAFADTPAPTLDELLTLCEQYDFEILNIELKPSRANDFSVVGKTIDLVKQHGLFDRLLISSFSSHMIIEAKKIDRQCKTAYLFSPERKEYYRMWRRSDQFAREVGAAALHPFRLLVTKDMIEKAHAVGVKVNVWTINREADILKLTKMGADGLITDAPDVTRSILENAGYLPATTEE